VLTGSDALRLGKDPGAELRRQIAGRQQIESA